VTGEGRVVLVTGGARGIGAACVARFAGLGYRVATTQRHTEPDALPDGVLVVPCDITDTDQVDAAFTRIEAELGPVEVVVANAGRTADGLVLRMSDDDFESVVDTNLTGSFRVARRAVPKMMRARFGRIIFVSSVVAATGQAGQVNYAASKAGLVGLARSLAREFASRKVTVNVVAPGPIDTDMLAAVSDDARAQIEGAVPLGRTGTPDEVAAAIAFLAADDSGFITGAVLPVDGGLGMGAW
jgi:NAD(P)-dependent dehydrogenase (short-subunit alcohol dehydrogenase family)